MAGLEIAHAGAWLCEELFEKKSKSGREYFRLGAESYSRRKKEKKTACPFLDVFACGQASSPRLYRLSSN